MFRGFIWDQKLYTAIVTAMTLHYIIDRWRTMTDTLPPDDPQGSLKTEVAVAECFVLECVGADKQPFITTRK